MPFEINWLLEDAIIHIDLVGDLYVDELEQLSDDVNAILDTCSRQKVHVVVNQDDLTNFPLKFDEAVHVMDFVNHPNMGWYMVYGPENPIMSFLDHVVASTAQLSHRRFKSLNLCLDFLRSIDLNLINAVEKNMN